jgi:hypothetical protein
VIQGRELGKEEWDNIRQHSLIKSSTAIFGKTLATDIKIYDPTENMKRFAKLAQKIARKFLNMDISVSFYTSRQVMAAASYGNCVLNVNVTRLGKSFFDNPVSVKTIDIIVHELGHDAGLHTEESYHKLITKLAGELTMAALNEPEFFNKGDNHGK